MKETGKREGTRPRIIGHSRPFKSNMKGDLLRGDREIGTNPHIIGYPRPSKTHLEIRKRAGTQASSHRKSRTSIIIELVWNIPARP